MGKLADALKQLQKDPENLADLPKIIAQVEEVEGQDEAYQERIQKLQKINRDYLAQIPIPGEEPKEQEQEKEPTLDDAREHIIQSLGGNQ